MTPPDALDVWLERGLASGELRPVDAAFARFGRAQLPRVPVEALLAAACLSRRVGDGHVCLRLDEADGDAGPCRRWLARRCAESPACLDHPDWIGNGTAATPLVRHGPRLYLWRHWVREQAVARALASRLTAGHTAPPPDLLRPWLAALFRPSTARAAQPDWQCIAAALAARGPLAVITGGPGTGKTTTVVRLLALLQGIAVQQGRPPLRIGLAAPTGKAAARLGQSITGALDGLPWAALPLDASGVAVLRDTLPTQVSTLHRLIGRHPDGPGIRHDAEHPLWLDVLVIDEASMVDLELLYDTLQAIPAGTRLVLLGDRDQLASVEAGAVLAQLCERARDGHYRPDVAHWLQAATGQALPPDGIDPEGTALDQAVVMLRHSHRFGADSGIGRWAAAVNAGEAETVAALAAVSTPDVTVITPSPADAAGERAWRDTVLDGLRPLLRGVRAGPDDGTAEALARWARALLVLHTGFQVLCALREGPWGVAGLNARIARLLQQAGLLQPGEAGADGWYAGRPVLVTRNAPALGLMNGDLGLVLPWPPRNDDPDRRPRWRVAFAAPDTPLGVRWALPGQLPDLETAFALTVHKSQGSEFDHVLLALPPAADNPLLSRELLYTGITRARRRLTLALPGGTEVLRAAVARPTHRDGGLPDALRTALP